MKNIENINVKEFKFFLLNTLILLILVVPTAYPIIKLILVILIILINFGEIFLKKTLSFDLKVFYWIFILVLINFFILSIGTHADIQLFLQLIPSYVISPILYAFALVIGISNLPKKNFHGIFLFSLFIINIYIFYLILNYHGLLPSSFLLDLDIGMTINTYGGYLAIFIPAITSLFFLGPYFVIMYSMGDSLFYQKYKQLVILVIIMTLLSSVIIGRRALLGLILISFILEKVFSKNKKMIRLNMKQLTYFFILFLTVLFVGYHLISFLDINLRVDIASEKGFLNLGIERQTQFNSLINGWKENMILGHGYGVNAEYYRSIDVPGAYELSYIALLFQGGMFGFLIIMSLYFLIFFWLWKIMKKSSLSSRNIMPLLGGYMMIMIANATNPYIYSFDGLFFLFFPLAIINQNLILKCRSEC